MKLHFYTKLSRLQILVHKFFRVKFKIPYLNFLNVYRNQTLEKCWDLLQLQVEIFSLHLSHCPDKIIVYSILLQTGISNALPQQQQSLLMGMKVRVDRKRCVVLSKFMQGPRKKEYEKHNEIFLSKNRIYFHFGR